MQDQPTPKRHGRPRIHPIPEPVLPTVVECFIEGREDSMVRMTCSGALSDAEVLQRFGVGRGRYTVRRYEEGEDARVIHRPS